MRVGRYKEEIKTRVEKPVKKNFEALAKHRDVDVAALARNAFDEFLEKNQAEIEEFQRKKVAA